MAIATLENYAEAAKQLVICNRAIGSLSSRKSSWTGAIPGAGGAGGSAGSTTAGAVPTNATTGAAPIIPFSGVGYVTSIEATDTIGGRYCLVDRLFHCGSYTGAASQTLSSQPSFSSRIPSGTDYKGLFIVFEVLTATAGAPSLTVTYTDQSGNTGHTTGAFTVANTDVPSATILPLAAGDTGVSKIESVAMTGVAGGTWNVFIARPLADIYLPAANASVSFPLEATGMPQVWSDSCLMFVGYALGTGTHTLSAAIEIASN